MGIIYDEARRCFQLDTASTTYLIALAGEDSWVGHLYYGPRLPDCCVDDYLGLRQPGGLPLEKARLLESFRFEYPTAGLGDFRPACLSVRDGRGQEACALRCVSHTITPGKPPLPGLPATFGGGQDCSTLELCCRDDVLSLEVTLRYTVFQDCDAITRSVTVRNRGAEALTITRCLSACLDTGNEDFDLITLPGGWGAERQVCRRPVTDGIQGVSSHLGRTGHHAQPAVLLASRHADDDQGDVYALHLIYSGNHVAQTYLTPEGGLRAVVGINPEDFAWRLDPGESFTSPEAVCVYSAQGLGGMSRTLHTLYRRHLLRGQYAQGERPVLLNSWEAMYFDFDTQRVCQLAQQASRLGIELLVLDDGWFGKRNDDRSSLGDWVVNEEKLPGGLKALADNVNALGMKFGLWFEPEMVSPDSALYRAHPDWAFHLEGREPTQARNQLILDLTRREVLEYVWDAVRTVLGSANIEYVKWDMNRPITDLGSSGPWPHGELYHRYVLAVYELQERLVTQFPHILLENCSSGGGRFDPGMLYYSPQIWTSDNTDAYARLELQRGTALLYPLSTLGAHVSDCPNHTVGRTTPLNTRANVALAGTFGYELDVGRISQDDRDAIPGQVALYHRYNHLVRDGDYYRLANLAQNGVLDAWMVVAPDRSEALVTCVQGLARPRTAERCLRLRGLDPQAQYLVEGLGTFSGQALMSAGVLVRGLRCDFDSLLYHVIRA